MPYESAFALTGGYQNELFFLSRYDGGDEYLEKKKRGGLSEAKVYSSCRLFSILLPLINYSSLFTAAPLRTLKLVVMHMLQLPPSSPESEEGKPTEIHSVDFEAAPTSRSLGISDTQSQVKISKPDSLK
jgi:hypothetical protein